MLPTMVRSSEKMAERQKKRQERPLFSSLNPGEVG
ncbi:hypothetical protein N181_22405 [Sinorhizobium fredii USDA 205]|nr:hypothetical protein N181_22405 [Sinorhizobium fredii USDA 205]